MSKPREAFTGDDDKLLIKYIATYAPAKDGRMGNNLYKRLAENSSNKWPWSGRHPWQSWRERYKKEEARFDAEIRKYQKRHAIEVPEKNKPTEADHLPTKVKTQDVVKNESRERHATNEEHPVRKIGPANAARKTMSSTDREALEEKVEIGQKRKATTEEKKEGERMEPKRRRVEGDEDLLPRHPVVDDEASADIRTSNTADANHLTSNNVPGLQTPQASIRSGEHIAVDSQASYKSPARQEVAVQVTSSPSQNQEYQHVNDKLISAFRNLGRSIGREQLVEAIRWNGLDADIEARILAETQYLDGKDPDSEDRKDREDTDTLSSRAMSPESPFDPDNILISSCGGSDSGAEAESHSAEDNPRNETIAKPAAQKTILRNMGNKKINKKNRKDDEDIFASDTDAPDPAHENITCPGGITATQASQAGPSKTNRPRAPPQTTYGHFRPKHAPGKKGPPYERIPDMNSDSDSESDAPAAPPTTWPPPRQKKLLQPTANDETLSKLKVEEKNKAPDTHIKTSQVHENDDVTGAQAGSADVHQLSQYAEIIPNERTTKSARESVAPKPRPSRPSPPREKESQDIAKDIQAWRENTDVQVKDMAVVSPMPSASVDSLSVAKQEGPMSHSRARAKTAPRIDHNRRQTFGGFTGKQTLPFKEVDLRRTVGRRSIATGRPIQDLPRTSLTSELATDSKLKHSRRSSMASSVASTIELLTDSDLPDVPILPDDGEMAMRIGFSHIFKAMADNHGVPEQWLRDTYKLLGSIRKTDELGRAAAIAAGQVGSGEPMGDEEELEVDSEEGEDPGSTQDSPVPITTSASKRTPMQNEKLLLQGSSGRKVALNITPADEDSVPRIRETYSPPRPSRAAKYARLKKEGREEEAKERERRRASSHSPSKRLETEPSHSSPVRPTSIYSGSPSVSPFAENTSGKPTLLTHKVPWTAEEDEIIRRGDDVDALREIEERRGTGSVYERTIELTGDGLY